MSNRQTLRTGPFVSLLFLILGFTVSVRAASVEVELPQEVEALLLAAGNANTDQTRLDHLKQVQAIENLPSAFREDLDQMIDYVNLWANGYEVYQSDNYLSRILRMTIAKKYRPSNTKGTALDSIYRYYSGLTRLLGIVQGFGKFSMKPKEVQLKVYRQIVNNFKAARNAFPQNELAAMFCGEPMPWPAELELEPDPNAPEWANLQREGLEKLRQIMLWWIEHRQKPEGFFGTGWGDDVEMWRNFTPLTVAFDTPEVAASQALLSEAIFDSPHMEKGFTSTMTDVEHATEDSSDTITPMLVLAPEESIWKERTLRIFNLAKDEFSGLNDQGQLQFKSTFLNVDGIQTDPEQACDTFYHARLMQPAFLLWQWRDNEEIGAFVQDWMRTWVEVSMGAEKGKPKGVIPTTIHWPDGKPGSTNDEWWAPENFKTQLYHYRQSSAISMIPNTMMLCYLMTKDPFYLQPIEAMAQHRLDYLNGKLEGEEVEGSLAWTASLSESIITTALTRFRLATGDDRFDPLLVKDASGYTKMRLTGDRGAMLEELRQNAEAFRVNFPLYTSACRAGDRVFVTPERYFREDRNPYVAPMAEPNLDVLYAMATGDPDTVLYCPVNAVRWETPPVDIAALVMDGTESRFEAELYHFGETSRSMAASLLRLEPGRYRAVLQTAGEEKAVLDDRVVHIEESGYQLALTLPSRKLCVLSIEAVSE